MAIPTFKKCCCCDLKWGALIVALFGLLDFFGIIYLAIQETKFSLLSRYLSMVLGVFYVVASILVIISLFVPKKEFPCVYLIVGIVEIIALIFNIIYFTVILCTQSEDKIEPLKHLINSLITLPISVYCWWVIYSWYKKLQSPAE